MPKIGRREFIGGALASSAALLAPSTTRAGDANIEVLINEPIGTIAPEIYSHFIEHLGGVVYDGVWVGEKSKIPNIGGIRSALVEQMRKIKPGVLRWPGGCFADSYNWHDGVGPRSERPRRTNFWIRDSTQNVDSPQVYDPNQFGTNEFMHFCKLIGAQPYFAANLRSYHPKISMNGSNTAMLPPIYRRSRACARPPAIANHSRSNIGVSVMNRGAVAAISRRKNMAQSFANSSPGCLVTV